MINKRKTDLIKEEDDSKNYRITSEDFILKKDEEHIADSDNKEELDRNTKEANTKPDKDKIW